MAAVELKGIAKSFGEVQAVKQVDLSFEEGTFTTCRCPEEGRNPWEIRAEETDVEVGGYATTRNSSFHILGFPIIWLPWMRYPVKTERETGFLLPEFSISGRSGVGPKRLQEMQREMLILHPDSLISER